MHAYEKLTHIVDGEPRIISDPPLIVPIVELLPPGESRDQIESEIRDLFRGYRGTLDSDRRVLLEQFRYVDLARKVVGVGSVGTRDRIALFLGVDGQDPALPPDQGGAAVGARAVRGQERVPEPRPAGRRRAAVDAGRHRHLHRLAARQSAGSTGRNGTSTCAN